MTVATELREACSTPLRMTTSRSAGAIPRKLPTGLYRLRGGPSWDLAYVGEGAISSRVRARLGHVVGGAGAREQQEDGEGGRERARRRRNHARGADRAARPGAFGPGSHVDGIWCASVGGGAAGVRSFAVVGLGSRVRHRRTGHPAL